MATILPAPIIDDLYAYYGRNLIETLEPYAAGESPLDLNALFESLDSYRLTESAAATVTAEVGILGAGIGGLYAALMLQSLDIDYKIIEESGRTGGRLFTHKFKGTGSGEFDYFDVGAMRFPKTQNPNPDKADVMGRLFHLFEYGPLNAGADKLKDRLIPYHFAPEHGNGIMYFNGVREQRKENQYSDKFQWDKMVETEYIGVTTVEAILHDVTAPFTDEIMKDLASPGRKVGWNKLMELNAYSARAYMSTKYIPSASLGIPRKPLPTDVVNWCETLNSSTGNFDGSFSEMVLEGVAFGADRPANDPFDWKCLRGGSQVLSNAVEKHLRETGGKIRTESRVTSISFDKAKQVMKVGILHNKKLEEETFRDVISTLPLPCLRTLNLRESGISVEQANALRQLTYGPSIKIGMRFESAWWTTKKGINGGQSYTDCPVRMVVYPSHGDGTSNTLIASYSWTEDAQRFGSLMGTGKPEFEEQIKEIVIRDLASVHGGEVTEEFLLGQYREHFAWNWVQPRTMGAFAFFGPGQFELPYRHLNLPAAKGHLHFAGEALSTRHAWVVGALDSAWRAVNEIILLRYGPGSAKHKAFTELWGENWEWRAKGEKGEKGQNLFLRHLHLGAPELFKKHTK